MNMRKGRMLWSKKEPSTSPSSRKISAKEEKKVCSLQSRNLKRSGRHDFFSPKKKGRDGIRKNAPTSIWTGEGVIREEGEGNRSLSERRKPKEEALFSRPRKERCSAFVEEKKKERSSLMEEGTAR